MKKLAKATSILIMLLFMIIGIQNSSVVMAMASENGVIYIHNQQELLQITSNPSGNYKLANNITLSNDCWNTSILLKGTFDGAGYTISNFQSQGMPLFDTIEQNAVLKNLTLTGYLKYGEEASTHYNALLVGYNLGVIENCVTNGKVESANGGNLSGMINQNDNIVRNCTNNAEVKETYKPSSANSAYIDSNSIGWVAGLCSNNNGYLDNCINNGNVTANQMMVGGLVSENNQYSTIINSTNNGMVKSEYSAYGISYRIGGIAASNSGLIYKSTNKGEIYSSEAAKSDAGGIAGEMESFCEIIDSVNYGKVTGYASTGGICGEASLSSGHFDNDDNFIVNPGYLLLSGCENHGVITGYNVTGGITGMTYTEGSEIVILNCNNYGNISTYSGFTPSGIDACIMNDNGGITIANCNNYGTLKNNDTAIESTLFGQLNRPDKLITSIPNAPTAVMNKSYTLNQYASINLNKYESGVLEILSDNPVVCSTDTDLNISAKSAGTCHIRVVFKNGAMDTITVTVKGNPTNSNGGNSGSGNSNGGSNSGTSTTPVKNGLVAETNGEWHLYNNNRIVSEYTGLYHDPVVGWWYVENGKINFSYTGLYNDATCGWWLVEGGRVSFGYTGLYNDANCGWWLIEGGRVAFEYTGLYNDANCGWWLIEGGSVSFGYTGLYNDANCGWWLVDGGRVAFDYTGLYNDVNCGWWLIGGGRVTFEYNGLYNDARYGWWMIAGGCVNFNYAG